jgi:hypothetical protein
MPAPHPRMHGLTHVAGGPDPVPGLLPAPPGSFTDWVLALPGVWAYWPLQDASGDAQDLGPLNADLQPVGTPAYRVGGPNSGDLQHAVRLAGVAQTSIVDDSFWNTADDLNVGSYHELTAMCWVRPAADDTTTIGWEQPVIGTWDVFRTGWTLGLSNGTRQLLFNSGNGSSSDYVLGPAVPAGAWALVGATRGDDGVTLYVNGSQVENGPGGPLASTGHGIRVGAADYNNVGSDAYHFRGDLAGAVFVAYALTGGQMLAAYEAFTGSAAAGGSAGQVLTLDENGTPTWAAPGVEVTHGDGTPVEAPVTNPPSLSGPTNGSGWHLQAHVETAVLYDSSPARFDVPSRKWVRVPFNTVRIQRRWETTVNGPVKEAWLPDDRGLTEAARDGLLHIGADMGSPQDVSGWFAIEYPVLDFTGLPDYGPETGTDAYARAARIVDASTGQVLRETPGSSDRQFFEWLFREFAADGLVGIVQAAADSPYPAYAAWAARPMVKPGPYPQIDPASSRTYYMRDAFYGGFSHEYGIGLVDASLAAGANLCLQAWQDTPWTLRFSTDHFPNYTPLPYPELWKQRPYLAVSYSYDPDSVDHTTGRLL